MSRVRRAIFAAACIAAIAASIAAGWGAVGQYEGAHRSDYASQP